MLLPVSWLVFDEPNDPKERPVFAEVVLLHLQLARASGFGGEQQGWMLLRVSFSPCSPFLAVSASSRALLLSNLISPGKQDLPQCLTA